MTAAGRRLAAAVALGAAALGVGGLALAISAWPSMDPSAASNAVGLPVNVVVGAALGWLIASRRPRNAIGWLMLALASISAIAALGLSLAIRALAGGAFAGGWVRWAGWAGLNLTDLSLGVLAVLLAVYPSGRAPGSPWRWAAAVAAGGAVLLTAAAAVDPAPFVVSARLPDIASPLGVSALRGLGSSNADNAMWLLEFASLLFLGIGLVVRMRRATGLERQQLKWLAYFSAGVGVVLVLFGASFLLFPGQAGGQLSGLPGVLTNVIGNAALGIGMPAAIAAAILQYRLYDIDVVVNRALVYGLLAAFITAVYMGLVVGVGSVIGISVGSNLFLAIVATALVALAFQPVRSRTQQLANRVVYGRRATPYEVLADFSHGIGEAYADQDILSRMARLIKDATDAASVVVWVRVGRELRPAAAEPAAGVDTEPAAISGQLMPALGADVTVPVRHAGEVLGAITLSTRPGQQLTPIESKLVGTLALQGGLVLRNVGLTESLKARVEELRASRQRVIAAQDMERRRLERNLHDGAQQHLVALKLKLSLLAGLIERDAGRAVSLSRELSSDTDEAIDAIRDLARGLYPPLLAERGLGAALAAQARRATLPVEVEADGLPRFRQEVEAAVYFCCLEAMQNVQKYAGAQSARVSLAQRDGRLEFEVADDGTGFDTATVRRGSGLTNMEDRLDALGGSFRVESGPGGTRLRGAVPVAQAGATA